MALFLVATPAGTLPTLPLKARRHYQMISGSGTHEML